MTATIFVTTTAVDTGDRPWLTSNHRRMVKAGKSYGGADFALVDAAEAADFILFVDSSDPYLGDVLKSPLYRSNSERSYVYNHTDDATPVVPGIYPDMAGPVRLPSIHLGGFYLRCFENAALLARGVPRHPKYLFSFVGNARNAPAVRRAILKLQHPNVLLLDRSSGLRDDDLDYVETLRDSAFVICPKGLGPTSWRIYETMMASRVPVIVSDRWVPARELDWPSFSLRVRECEVAAIPDICEDHAPRAEEMGQRARAAWERCCATDTAFGWVGRRLHEIRAATPAAFAPPTSVAASELFQRGKVLKYLKLRTKQWLASRIRRPRTALGA